MKGGGLQVLVESESSSNKERKSKQAVLLKSIRSMHNKIKVWSYISQRVIRKVTLETIIIELC